MMTRSEIVVALGALAVAVLTAGCQTTLGAEPLRVATYNIRLQCGKPGSPDCWEERRDELVRTIRNMNLDAFGLQEVCPGQMAYLKEKLPEFAFVGDHREKDRKTGEASPVAYRKTRFDAEKSGTFWLSETPDVPASKSWGTYCTRVCSYLVLRDKTSGRRLCFANTHTDHISAEAREKGMMLIIDKMKAFGAGYPIVFVGDHNCRENETPAQHVATRLANALYLTETPPEGGWRTWNGWRWREKEVSAREALALSVEKRNESRKATVRGKAAKVSDVLDDTFYEKCGGPRIDYIYVTPGTRVLDYRTVNDVRSDRKMYPSDHFPVVATIVLPAPMEEFEACCPATRFTTAPWWTSRLGETRGRILGAKGACYDLVMVGDSITHRWENRANGAAVYPKLQKKYKVLNLGNGGDRTQNVIWRFENNGELDDYTAKVFMVMIGVNNGGKEPEGTVAGVKKIVGMIRAKHPESKIVLLAILPHGKNPKAHVDLTKVNPQLKAFAEESGCTWLDMGERFLDETGEIRPGLMMPDNLHPIAAGYEIWFDAMCPVVDRLLES